MIRTEEEILKDFGKLGYYINEIPGAITLANHNKQKIIYVNKLSAIFPQGLLFVLQYLQFFPQFVFFCTT